MRRNASVRMLSGKLKPGQNVRCGGKRGQIVRQATYYQKLTNNQQQELG